MARALTLEPDVDIARPDLLEKKKKRQLTWIGVGVAAVVLLTLGLSRLKPAAPTVERATVVIDTVKRGEMLRQVRGLGTLVPEDIRWIPAPPRAASSGVVVLPGHGREGRLGDPRAEQPRAGAAGAGRRVAGSARPRRSSPS